MGVVLLLIVLAALFATTGLLAVGVKWLLVMAAVIAVSSMFTLRYGGRLPN